jgi:hypothetical protein
MVTIKVLPVHLMASTELRERFECEARTVASLNHPHMSAHHDIGQQDGVDYWEMEYPEGETLAVLPPQGRDAARCEAWQHHAGQDGDYTARFRASYQGEARR